MSESWIAWLEAGQQALEAGRFPEAIAAFTGVRDALPGDASIAVALANVYRLSGDIILARASLHTAFATAVWTDPHVAFTLGSALLDTGAAFEAAECFEHVVSLLPHNAAALGALAGARRTLGDPTTAWSLIQRAVAEAPEDPALLLTAAQVRHDHGDIDGALHWLDRADAKRPNHAPTQIQRAYSLLLRGASCTAWAAFEARPLPSPKTAARPWNGESLQGASVLVTAEQGVGDQFQFLRFVGHLTERGAARVVVECHADAVRLLVANGYNAVARGAPPETHWHVPLLSLPHRLGLDTDVCDDRVPYLRAPAFSTTTRESSARRIGLVWAGNSAFPGRVTRDFDPALLPEIVATNGIEWVSLQHGEAGTVSFPRLTRFTVSSDWAATADVLVTLDGLVTTDTGIAHLAGAMGVRCWVMLQRVPDWRWGLTGHQSAWYPTLRLVRQLRWRDWQTVVTQLKKAVLE